MKHIILTCLCGSILLQSCAPTSLKTTEMSTSEECLARLRSGTETLTIRIGGGEPFVLEGGKYLLVSEPGDYYFGNGTFINYRDNTEQPFSGKYVPVKVTADSNEQGSGKILCWRNDTSAVVFRKGDYVKVSPENGTGLYIFGRTKPVPADDIEGEEIEKISPVKTVFAVIVGGVITAVYGADFIRWFFGGAWK